MGAADALVGGATPSQLCLMLSLVVSCRSTCCLARAAVGTSTSAAASTTMPAAKRRRTSEAIVDIRLDVM
jgi:hypothetical protein